VIPPEQLTAALVRLDPRDWEVLDLSLRRRVPDEALADVLDVDEREVARRRAAAIEKLADDIGVQRGYDLGLVLKALLDVGTWEAAEAQGAPSAPVAKPPPPEAAPEEEEEEASEPAPAPVPSGGVHRFLVPAVATVAALVAAGGAAAVVLNGSSDDHAGSAGSGPRAFTPQKGGALAVPFPSDPNVSFRYLTAYVRRPTVLYSSPGGRRRLKISARTEWGSPRVLSVVQQSGRWLGVTVSELPNGEVGWLPERGARLGGVTWSIHVDVSKRRLKVRRNGHVVRSTKVAVGSSEHPTPTGRFAVTDRLKVHDGASPYGCCVLALTGHQRDLPPDWPGGDRLAIHATTDEGSIGHPVSLGCMRLQSSEGRWLIKTIPIGTPVFIHS
jgi:L,D-transpeptidase catalytic domain